MPLTAFDVFSGCGGLSTGIKQAGFNLLGALEIDEVAASTYSLNHPDVFQKVADVRMVPGKTLLRELGLKKSELDLLAGCSPCQGFSRLRKDGQNDDRNTLVLEFVRLVEEIRPKTIFMENVPGLIKTESGRAIFRQTEQRLTQLGYFLDYDIINVVDYGVPQFRRRFILIGSRLRKRPISIPNRTHISPQKRSTSPERLRWNTVRDAIGRVPPIGNGEKHPEIPLHYAARNTPAVLERIRLTPHNGGSRNSLPPDFDLECHKKCPKGFKDVYGRMSWDKPCPTLTGSCTNISKGRFMHPEQDRGITPYEAALLQTFPDNYRFNGNATHVALQIGNAVPVRLGYIISKRIYESLLD